MSSAATRPAVAIRSLACEPSMVREFAERLQTCGADVVDLGTCDAVLVVVLVDDADQAASTLAPRRPPELAVCLSQTAPDQVWRLIERGACDVIDGTDLERASRAVAGRAARLARITDLAASRPVRDALVGTSRAWLRSLGQLIEVAHFSRASVLITGESGTGKELAARLIHALDTREHKGNLVVLDCGTVSPELARSELFGHVRGAYTGAIVEREGVFSLADGGTLFLDELGELPPPVQAQMLRALEEGAFKPVGSTQWKRTNFRLVCATNRDVEADVRDGRFRLDLYHRLMAWHVHLPPLRDRPEDILPLAKHFARTVTGRAREPAFDPAVERYLVSRDYPGNVRDLRQLITRIMTLHEGEQPITPGDVPIEDRPAATGHAWPDEQFELAIQRALQQGRGMKAIGREAEAVALRTALEVAEGNSRRAAEVLGITERAVQMRRSTHGASL